MEEIREGSLQWFCYHVVGWIYPLYLDLHFATK